MKLKNLVCIMVLAAVLLPLAVLAQEPTEEWVRRYGTMYDGRYYGRATSIAVDSFGNIYVAGDVGIVKYDTSGNELWVRNNISYGYNVNVIVDSSDNVYVQGNAITIKYDSDGNELWSKRYGSGGRTPIAVDLKGNVYVTGVSSWEWGGQVTVKYDPNGNILWATKHNGGSTYLGIAVDSKGNVYVSGLGNWSEAYTVKYDSNGNELWARRYEYDALSHGTPYIITVDSKNDVYVTGWANSPSDSGRYGDYALTIKYDTNGNVLWARRYDGGNDDGATAIAVDPKGNVYITEATEASYEYNLPNVDVVKYDSSGNELWVRKYENTYNDCTPNPNGLKVDSSGNVYVIGRAFELGWSYPDYVTIKYDTNGNRLWVKNYDSGYNDEPAGLALDSANNVYVTGSSCASSGCEYTTIKYSQDYTSSLISLIQYFLSQGVIANQGIANSMIQKIQNGAIGAFLNFLNAQDGKQIDSAAAAILRTAAGAL